jgi:hypothetical protein
MSRDRWDRPCRVDDMLNRHLFRTGVVDPYREDAYKYAVVGVTRDLLRVVEAVCEDEDLDPDVTRRILQRVIYGAVPLPSEVRGRVPAADRAAQGRAVPGPDEVAGPGAADMSDAPTST